MSCVACSAGFDNECFEPVDGFCCCGSAIINITAGDTRELVISRTGKSAGDMKDPISTGRKRAAQIKPIPEEGMVCEWRGLLTAGGGVEPIIGCNGNSAVAIHHGPDKDVLNNDPDTNLHRICIHCHNRWHTLNDKYYGLRPTPGTPFIPMPPFVLHEHDATTKASIEQIFQNEMSWSNKPTVKAKD